METKRIDNGKSRNSRRYDFPELQVGFPERNDVESPSLDMERIHVDFSTLNISRKNGRELTREIKSANVSAN
jgi:hypothetical protein